MEMPIFASVQREPERGNSLRLVFQQLRQMIIDAILEGIWTALKSRSRAIGGTESGDSRASSKISVSAEAGDSAYCAGTFAPKLRIEHGTRRSRCKGLKRFWV